MSDKYAGACWNALMKEETKESIAELYMDSIRERRALTAENARLKAPVSEDEFNKFACDVSVENEDGHMIEQMMWRDDVNALIAARANPPKETA